MCYFSYVQAQAVASAGCFDQQSSASDWAGVFCACLIAIAAVNNWVKACTVDFVNWWIAKPWYC
jgi:hypothetical protein